MTTNTLGSRRFWAVLLTASLLAAFGAWQNMRNQLPLLRLDIPFTSAKATAAAAEFQRQQFPDLHADRSAVSFETKRDLQAYVELEGGGIAVFQSIMNNPDAVTHYWRVRNFAQSQQQELITAYSPKGEFLSFAFTLPDQAAGAALDERAARAIAEQGAQRLLGARFAAYQPLEVETKKQSSGRVDYTFKYEHPTLLLGEARFRLLLRVAGDQLVSIDTPLFIPEAFNQRFSAMRALNTQISQIAGFFMMGLLGLGGVVGGGIWLHRCQQLLWKRALLPAVFVGAGLAAANLANLPISWMGYNTTATTSEFLMQQLAGAATTLVALSLLFSLIYAVAEGLSRMAFAQHPRLFDFHRTPVAASPEALGRVLGAYGFTGFFLLYAATFSSLSQHWLGWWSPADSISDPNVLASASPALGPIFTSLMAGTWEECVFRAVPLALASLIGQRFGLRRPLVIAALVLQALIFGGAHADYPNLPGYSRLVELFIPSLAFGLVYLRFGLVVGMLTHFLYDLVVMSLPIMVASDASLLSAKALVVLAAAAPLLLVLVARYRAGGLIPLASVWRNGQPTATTPTVEEATTQVAVPTGAHAPLKFHPKIWVPLSALALVILISAWQQPAKFNWPSYTIDRNTAQTLAEAELQAHGVLLTGEWHSVVQTFDGWRQPMDFVWEVAGKDTFGQLVDRYLDSPLWHLTWRKFDGPVEDRAEKWEVYLKANGKLHELVHTLPEAAPGAKLTREQATAHALAWISDHHWATPAQLEEKSVVETLRPARSDWVVRYADPQAFNQNKGVAVISITLSGDEVTGAARFIDVPEDWTRHKAQTDAAKTPWNIANKICWVLLLGLALKGFLGKHQGQKINTMASLPWVVLVVSSFVLVSASWGSSSLINFQTSLGWNQQLLFVGFGLGVGALFQGVVCFFMAQALHGQRPLAHALTRNDYLAGAAIALLIVGLNTLIGLLLPTQASPPIYSADWSTFAPWPTVILNGTKALATPFAILVLAIGASLRLHSRALQSLAIGLLAITALTTLGTADEPLAAFFNELVKVCSLVVIYQLVRRQQLGVAIAITGLTVAFGQLGIHNALYPTAWLHALSSVLCVAVLTYALLRHWYKRGLPTPAAQH